MQLRRGRQRTPFFAEAATQGRQRIMFPCRFCLWIAGKPGWFDGGKVEIIRLWGGGGVIIIRESRKVAKELKNECVLSKGD